MSDETINKDHLNSVSREREMILERVTHLRTAMNDIDSFLKLCVENGKKNKKTKTTASQQQNEVMIVIPNIKHEYEKLSKASIPFLDLIRYFEFWITQLSIAVAANKKQLETNKRLMKHMRESLAVCRIVDYATKEHFGF